MVEWLFVGLGNPGAEYESSRHNVGANTVFEVAARHDQALKKSKELALTAEVRIGNDRVALAFPQTFMNDSGRSVQLLMRRYDIEDLERLVIVHDELDLEPGRIRLKQGGGLAGHNGLRSVTQHLKTQDYARIRMGVGKPPRSNKGADHVLRRPPKAVLAVLDEMIVNAAEAVESIVTRGFEPTMSDVNAVKG